MDKTVSQQIEGINYEVNEFLLAFRRFRARCNAIDKTLCTNLFKIVSEIDTFLESKPEEISLSQKEDVLTAEHLHIQGIVQGFICTKCDHTEKGFSLNNIRAHITSRKHSSMFYGIDEKEDKNKDNKNKEVAKTKQSNIMLPKKTKNLLEGDLHTFFSDNLAIAKKLLNLPDYKNIEDELIEVLTPAFPNESIKIYMFGSRLSGIGTRHSDLDIFIDIGGIFNTFENRPSEETVKKLSTVQKVLKDNPNWTQLIAIKNARVPILKIRYKPKSIDCDIGFSNSLGFCNTKLTKYLMELQPMAKALCFFFKKWIEKSRLDEVITTYSAVLMVVFYLQIKKLLPSIKTLQDGLEDIVEIGPWMANFGEKSLADLKIPASPYFIENFKKELKEFFMYYKNFDFKNNIICPYLGCMISVKNLETNTMIPRYIKFMEGKTDIKTAIFNNNCMHVQDPLQLNHNVTKSVPEFGVKLLKQYFELSANALNVPDVPIITDSKVAVKK